MSAYESFIFGSSSFDPEEGRIDLTYSLDDSVRFVETFLLPKMSGSATGNTLDAALQLLHLLAGVSYYKTCCPENISVQSGPLTEEQATFFQTAYENGLGEFAHKNTLNLWGKIQFPACHTEPVEVRHAPVMLRQAQHDKRRVLVPLGGGKDSIITVELLKKAGYEVTLLRVGAHPFITKVAEIAGLPLLTIDRRIAPELFRANAIGALNGHVPITGILSALAVVVAEIGKFDAVVWSNERSASFGNVSHEGHEVNHQWSKGLAFERMFQKYLRDYVTTSITSFSLLRPWSELRIVQEFVKYPKYFDAFTSCNTNWKLQTKSVGAKRWCLACPKCAFAYALFAAHLDRKTLDRIFGGNAFAEEKLLPAYRQLLGIEGFKPFECVGTPDEVKAAFLMAHTKGALEDTAAMQMFVREVLPGIKNPKVLMEKELTNDPDHAIPDAFLSVLPR